MAPSSSNKRRLSLPIFTILIILSLNTIVYAAAAAKGSYFLPITKDPSKQLQYYSTLQVGTPPTRVNAVIDLGNLFSWFTCKIVGYNHSSTYKNINCNTPKCKALGQSYCSGCLGENRSPSCNNNSCGADSYTPWSNALYAGGLIEDVITNTIYHRDGKTVSPATIPALPLTCAPDKGPLKGLSPYTKGVITLARTPVALQNQISSTFKLPRKFALCLPSSNTVKGAIYFGGGPYFGLDLSKSLVTVRLVVNPHSTAPVYSVGDPSIEYFLTLKSIEIDSTSVRFPTSLLKFDKNGKGGARLSTLTPYTTLHPQIYKPFLNTFLSKSAGLKLVKVAPVSPFSACFTSKSIRYNAKTGAGLPVIDLVINGEKNVVAKWSIYGSNSMVSVSPDVQCLGFVESGASEMTAVVIGGKQMEDNLIELDLESNKIGFTSSLLRIGTSCSSPAV